MPIHKSLPHDISAAIPWWTMNGDISHDEARQQLDEMVSHGVFEFFLYPTFGLIKPDFLTEDWFDFIAFLIEECPKRNMRFWIYDELSWPSGTSGGRLLRDHPQYAMRSLRQQRITLEAGMTWTPGADISYVTAHIIESGENLTPVRTYTNNSASSQTILAIHNVLIDDLFFASMGTSGTWNQCGVMDALNPEAVRAWMGYNYIPFKERFPKALGTIIRGFFFDEPTMVSPFHTGDIPWTPGIEDLFKETYGYELTPHYWQLFEADKTALQFRYDFWRLVGNRYAEAFAKQLMEWSEENNLMFTGHDWPEEPSCQRLMTTAIGDLHYQQQYLHIPGTDYLYYENCFAEHAGMAPQIKGWERNLIYSSKHPSSTARYNNATYTICESSGCLGTKVSPPIVQKLMYDFLYAMGISLINPARPVDLSDFRKHTCYTDIGQPYWKYYRRFTEYAEILRLFNSRGRTDTKLAVLNPVSTKFAFSNITPDTSIRQEKTPLPKEGDCAEAMLVTLDALVRKHIDFEILFEEVILESNISKNGEIIAPNSAFDTIILPHTTALDDTVWKKLEAFSQNGGKIITVGMAPTYPLRHSNGTLDVAPLPSCNLQTERDDFKDALAKLLRQPPFKLVGEKTEEILTQLRADGDWQALFLANGTPGKKSFTVAGEFAQRAHTVIDAQTGERHAWLPQKAINLKSGESLILTTDEPPKDATCYGAEQNTISLPSEGWRFTMPVPNGMRLKLERKEGEDFVPMDDNGACATSLDPDISPTVTLRGTFTIKDEVPSDLRLWFERENVFSNVSINGHAVSKWRYSRLFDEKNVALPIAEVAQLGENTVIATMSTYEWLKSKHGIRIHLGFLMNGCMPLIIMGNFSADETAHTIGRLPDELSCGALEPQGFPQFPSEMTLENTFNALDCKSALLRFEETMLPFAVAINGVELGVRFWGMEDIHIPEGLLKPTDNKITLRLCGDIWHLLDRRWAGTPVEHIPFILPKTIN